MYILGLLKHRIFSNILSIYKFNIFIDGNTETDIINLERINMMSMPIDEMLCNYVPYLFNLEEINEIDD